ncbi:MAG: hypothetical protein PHF25_00575 [Candidatus Margulisbacteria bacterium]|nr:hypothetical protein [Candidatus Margulisiibacteriota bacterium]
MNHKVIAFNKNLAKWLDNLTEKENALAIYLQLEKGNAPKNVKLSGFFINPLALIPTYAKGAATRLENQLGDAYKQDPLSYIRLSTNIPMLQRIMVLEQPTTIGILEDIALSKDIYRALNAKFIGFEYPFENFIKELSSFVVNLLQILWDRERPIKP